jgi:glucose-1-phosphate cytidylyltransferase
MENFESLMILAGGKGTRFKEYTEDIPKPMIRALNKPLLIHIIDHYINYQVKKIVILAGYKKEVISDYFSEKSDKKISNDSFLYKDVNISILDTGQDAMTGARIRKGLNLIKNENFYLTYGDGIADVNISALTKFHLKNKAKVTLTAVRPPARFGSLDLKDNKVINFGEKTNALQGWINGGFFVVNRSITNDLDDNDNCIFEKTPLESVTSEGKLYAYKHEGFWQCVDTIRELEILERELTKNSYGKK